MAVRMIWWNMGAKSSEIYNEMFTVRGSDLYVLKGCKYVAECHVSSANRRQMR